MRAPTRERREGMGRLIGYARVSTAEQDLGLQLAALRRAGCSDAHIFCDTASGARTARPGLEACVHALEPGDTLVVWRLDRLGRSMTDGAIDTTTASGELVFHIFPALAQFERRLMQERTHAGLAVARARGKKGGRTPRHAEEPRVRMAYTMYRDQSLTVQDICRVLQISQATFYRYVALGRHAATTT